MTEVLHSTESVDSLGRQQKIMY